MHVFFDVKGMLPPMQAAEDARNNCKTFLQREAKRQARRDAERMDETGDGEDYVSCSSWLSLC